MTWEVFYTNDIIFENLSYIAHLSVATNDKCKANAMKWHFNHLFKPQSIYTDFEISPHCGSPYHNTYQCCAISRYNADINVKHIYTFSSRFTAWSVFIIIFWKPNNNIQYVRQYLAKSQNTSSVDEWSVMRVITIPRLVNTLRSRQNCRHFPDDNFNWIF